ncbi:DUF2313 domain-containing protein [Leuconostocaceae bacterium ESL0958]|nr:DUF2313 domain-containing protein [Leuconostocaceae bacterium ESL0958]
MSKLIRLKELMPDYYQGVLEMETLLRVEQFEIDNFVAVVERQANNQFVMTADKEGIAAWEQLVGIDIRPSFDLETRRYDVLARLLPPKPITIKYLREILDTLNINAHISFNPNKFHVDVDIVTTDPNAVRRLEKLLRGMLPSNLTFTAINSVLESKEGSVNAGMASIQAVKYTNKGEIK